MSKTKAITISEKHIFQEFEGDKFLKLYENWQKLPVKKKENILLAVTMQSTPKEWVKHIEFKDKYGKQVKIPYVEGWRAKRLLNLFFGFGNWSLEMQDIKIENGKSVVTGYLIIKWFNGTERKIPTAGRGKINAKNQTTSMGDDTKGAITDAIKKGLNNLGFFHDVYSGNFSDEKELDVEDESKKFEPNEKMLKEAIVRLYTDMIDGKEDVADRLEVAEEIVAKTPYNKLKLKLADMRKRYEKERPI